MATRRQVREAFYSELETAAAPTVGASRISSEYPNEDEDLPRIVHNDTYLEDPYNASGPIDASRNASGDVTEVVYASQMMARFLVTILDNDEQQREGVYEDVRSYFEKYEHAPWDASSIQTDVHDVNVADVTSVDSQDRSPPARGDQVTIGLSYQRKHKLTNFDNIAEIDHLIDADNDGVTDTTYTTT